VGGRGEPCGFAAALGRRWRLAHNSTGQRTAKRGAHFNEEEERYLNLGVKRQLPYAGRDAAKFAKAVRDKAGVEILTEWVLADIEASRELIIPKLSQTVAAAEQSDTIIIFIAGRGMQIKHKEYYLATSTTRLEDIENTVLHWGDVCRASLPMRIRELRCFSTLATAALLGRIILPVMMPLQPRCWTVAQPYLIFSALNGVNEASELYAAVKALFL